MADRKIPHNPTKSAPNGNTGWQELVFRAPADLTEVVALAKSNLEGFTRATDVMLSGMKELNEEVVNFAGNQFNAGAEAARSILSAETPAEALGRHVDYARVATQAYLAETTKLFDLATRISQTSFAAGKEAADAAKTAVEKTTRK